MSAGLVAAPAGVEAVARGRVRRASRRRLVVAVLTLLVVAAFAMSLVVGRTTYPPADVLRVVLGQDVPGASFTVGRLRLPRAGTAVVLVLSLVLGLASPLDSSLHGAYLAIVWGCLLLAAITPLLLATRAGRDRVDRIAEAHLLPT